MTRNPDARCGNCVYMQEVVGNEYRVQCRRYPLVALGDDFSSFPITGISAWCGEHPEFLVEPYKPISGTERARIAKAFAAEGVLVEEK